MTEEEISIACDWSDYRVAPMTESTPAGVTLPVIHVFDPLNEAIRTGDIDRIAELTSAYRLEDSYYD